MFNSFLLAEAETEPFLLHILNLHEIYKGQVCKDSLWIRQNFLVIISNLAERLSLTVHLLLHSYRLGMVNQQAATRPWDCSKTPLEKGFKRWSHGSKLFSFFSGHDQKNCRLWWELALDLRWCNSGAVPGNRRGRYANAFAQQHLRHDMSRAARLHQIQLPSDGQQSWL